MNTVRGAPEVTNTEPYANFAREKFDRTVAKVFQADCGYKMDRIVKLADRYDEMIGKMVSWTSRCKRFTGEACPSQCQLVDGECMMPKGKVNKFFFK